MNDTNIKQCSKCRRLLRTTKFYKQSSSNDGFKSACKDCIKEYENIPEIKAKIKKKKQEYNSRLEVKARKLKQSQTSERKRQMKEYRERPEVKQRKKEYLKSYKQRRNELTKMRMKEDVNFKIKHTLHKRLHRALKGELKAYSTLELLGCSIDEFKLYIKNKFKEGMTWENHSKWHLDHIKPCASFNLSDKSEQKKCFYYKNFQPLWAHENLTKNAKILDN